MARSGRGRCHARLAVLAACAAAATAALGSWSPLRILAASAIPLLGGASSWKLTDWRGVTDGVRGGASTANLRAVTDIGVAFSGKLETGADPAGAGFAGVAFKAASLPEPLTSLAGLRVDVAETDGREYIMSLSMRGAPAGMTHNFRFRPSGPGVVEMPFEGFAPELRGRPAPQPAMPLDPSRVELVGVELQGGPGQEAGEYSLVLQGVTGIPSAGGSTWQAPREGPTRWTCDACGTMNSVEASTCVRCGSLRDVKEVHAQARAKQEAATKPTRWKCDGCGASNFPTSSECHKCGAPRR